MRKSTPVRECMSRLPAETDRREPLQAVVRQMREHQTHHVPIMDGSHVYGILSSRDLQELATRADAKSIQGMTAGDLCSRDPLTVAPMTPVVEVAQAMLERGVGSALVTEGDILVGIFTSTDGLRVLARL